MSFKTSFFNKDFDLIKCLLIVLAVIIAVFVFSGYSFEDADLIFM